MAGLDAGSTEHLTSRASSFVELRELADLQHLQRDGPQSTPAERSRSRNTTSRRESFDSLETMDDDQQIPALKNSASTANPRKSSGALTRLRGLFQGTTWTVEILSCLVAFFSLLSVVAILSVHSGRPRPQWPWKITINALISVFTVIFKGALMMPIAEGIGQSKWLWFNRRQRLADLERFDGATRGVWGSVRVLLSRLPGSNGILWLVNLGAIISITSTAVDPFTQQIVQYRSCMRNGSETDIARLPQTQTYDNITTRLGIDQYVLDATMQIAIYQGLISPPANSSSAVTGSSCSTGNCTFPAFSTLAMCHYCSDISDTIIHTNTSYRLPSGLAPPLDNIGSPFSTSIQEYEYAQVTGFEALVRRNWYLDLDSVNSTDHPYAAYNCTLVPCLKTFEANVSNGLYYEQEISRQDLYFAGWEVQTGGPWIYELESRVVDQGITGGPYNASSIAVNSTLVNGNWEPCNPTPMNTTTNTYQINTTTMGIVSDMLDNTTSTLWYPDSCVWVLGPQAGFALGRFLGGFFDNNSLQVDGDVVHGDIWLMNLFNNGSITLDTVDAFMDGLDWTITAAMRQNSPDRPELATVTGVAHTLESCLAVQWAWISLPAALLAMEVLFLVAIMAMTRRAGSPRAAGGGRWWSEDWKNSSLALVFLGLDKTILGGKLGPGHADEDRGEELSRQADMYRAAERIHVKLGKDGDGWRLEEAVQTK